MFRPDREKVITPVVDWLLTRDDVDRERVAILDISTAMGFSAQLPPALLVALKTQKGPEPGRRVPAGSRIVDRNA